jgi:hypothetical protein
MPTSRSATKFHQRRSFHHFSDAENQPLIEMPKYAFYNAEIAGGMKSIKFANAGKIRTKK